MKKSDSKDDYPTAAVRHFCDANLLANNGRKDNAMCHYAFAAECAIKALYMAYQADDPRKYGHTMKQIWNDINLYYNVLAIMDAESGEWLGRMKIPEKLFCRHPERRYYKDIDYTDEEIGDSKYFTEQLIRKIVIQTLDGKEL